MVGGAPSPASTLVPARELDGQSASDVGLHVTGFGLWIRHVGRLERERLLRSGHVAGLRLLDRSALRRLAGLSCGGWLRRIHGSALRLLSDRCGGRLCRRARNALCGSGLVLLYGLSVLDGLGRGLLPYRFRGRLLRRHGLLALGPKRSALHGGLAERGRCGCRSLRRDRASRRLLRGGSRGFSRNVRHGRLRRWLHGLRGSRGWRIGRRVAG